MAKLEMPTFPQDGGCLCGAVRYRLSGLPKAVYACHCKDCQRTSNGTHTISMIVDRSDVTLVSGNLVVFEKSAESGRHPRMLRCEICGTGIWNEPTPDSAMLVMKAGNLDDMSWARPVGNIWTGSKAPWVEIDDLGPNYAGQPESRDALMSAWAAVHD